MYCVGSPPIFCACGACVNFLHVSLTLTCGTNIIFSVERQLGSLNPKFPLQLRYSGLDRNMGRKGSILWNRGKIGKYDSFDMRLNDESLFLTMVIWRYFVVWFYLLTQLILTAARSNLCCNFWSDIFFMRRRSGVLNPKLSLYLRYSGWF